MLDTIVITDLTQMRERDRVCIVGTNAMGVCIRPVVEPRDKGVPKAILFDDSDPIIRPGAKVEFDLFSAEVQLPHSEDRGFKLTHIVSKGLCSDVEWGNILIKSSRGTVNEIFDGQLQERSWVRPGANTRSIGTLAKPVIVGVGLTENNVKPRLRFQDGTGILFDCPVSDLTMWDMCYHSVKRQGRDRTGFSGELQKLLTTARRVYLRLGLARPWKQTPLSESRCYLQVTGVHTFPDYLGGKSFVDFSSR